MRLSARDARQEVQDYCNGVSDHPYFVCVDGATEYKQILTSIPGGFRKIRVSDYCEKDTLPDYDKFIHDVVDAEEGIVVLGIGESCFLTKQSRVFARLKDLSLSHKVVVIVRNCEYVIESLAASDSKFTSYRWCAVKSSADYSVVRVVSDMKLEVINGFRNLLINLEMGRTGKVYVCTDIDLVNCVIIHDAYDAIKVRDPNFSVSRNCLADSMWRDYLADCSLDEKSIRSWKYYLRLLIEGTDSPYLRLVLRNSGNYEEYRRELLNAILHVDWQNAAFSSLYTERKSLLPQFEEYEIDEFVATSKTRDTERIHYLTDTTIVEKRAIIEEISRLHIIPKELEDIYPALCDYLHDYCFTCNNGGELTSYFHEYKREKLLNELKEEFLQRVDLCSVPSKRLYTNLKTRKQVLSTEKVGAVNPGLYWLDALGVEFLGFIQILALKLGLSIKISIAKASLPTLTSCNRDFYDEWNGPKSDADKRLDNLKHHGCGNIVKTLEETEGAKNLPTYLADELVVIESVVHSIYQMLYQHHSEVVFLVSDHGASRLAVVNNHENKWKMASSGQHSGRCCPLNEIDEEPLSATREDRDTASYWVLANYDRFKGGRKADIEVHGGAALEEIVIPVIRFELKDKSISCHIMGGNQTILESLDGNPEISLYCSDPHADMVLIIKGKPYVAQQDLANTNKYIVKLDGIWRSGQYIAEVYDGDNRLPDITFNIVKEQKGSKKQNDGSEFFA